MVHHFEFGLEQTRGGRTASGNRKKSLILLYCSVALLLSCSVAGCPNKLTASPWHLKHSPAMRLTMDSSCLQIPHSSMCVCTS